MVVQAMVLAEPTLLFPPVNVIPISMALIVHYLPVLVILCRVQEWVLASPMVPVLAIRNGKQAIVPCLSARPPLATIATTMDSVTVPCPLSSANVMKDGLAHLVRKPPARMIVQVMVFVMRLFRLLLAAVMPSSLAMTVTLLLQVTTVAPRKLKTSFSIP